MSFFNPQPTPTPALPSDDPQVSNLPSDSTSSLSFSPTSDLLAVASWSSEVRIYAIGPSSGQSVGKAEYKHDGPVLCVQWSKDGSKVVSGGADKAARVFDVATGQASQVAVHGEAVKNVRWIDANGQALLATGSWDKTIKYWDMRAPTAVASVTLPERCYTMDVAYPLMVVGTAERHIQIFNLNNPTVPFKTMPSPLRWQTRVITCFPDATGFAVGSVEGRVAIQYLEDTVPSSNFSFKCQRKETSPPSKTSSVYAVNDISFHPLGTFSTSGADGTINFWDKESKTRLKTFDYRGGPIASTGFNHTGSIFAYAVTNDWSSGHSTNHPGFVNQIKLHYLTPEEIRPRPKK